MAQFTGFTCDDCGVVVESKTRVKRITRFESDDPAASGEQKEDLCKECALMAVSSLDLQPLRTRTKKETTEAPAEAVPTSLPGSDGVPQSLPQ